MGQNWRNCDAGIREWVEAAVENLATELGDILTGVYLHGSLASGSFYPPKSDVDLLFVVDGLLNPDGRRAFAETALRESAQRPIIGGLECSVVQRFSALAPIHPMPFEVHFGEDHREEFEAGDVDFTIERTDPDLAAHCQAINEFGICLRGAPVPDVFGVIQRDDFLDSVIADLKWILEGEHILESPFYAVLNSCRIHWIWSGHSKRLVPTKEEAGEWAKSEVPDRLIRTIDSALAAYRDAAPISAEERQSAGRRWEKSKLLEFRDWMRKEWSLRATHRK